MTDTLLRPSDALALHHDTYREVLPNGLTLLVRRDTSAPVVAIVTHVKAGYFDETDDIVGIAHDQVLQLRRRGVVVDRGVEFAAGEQLGGVEIAGGIGTAGDRGKIEAEEHRITQQHHGGEPSKPARSGSGGGVRI